MELYTARFDSGSSWIYIPYGIGYKVITGLLNGSDWLGYNDVPLVNCNNIDILPSLYISLATDKWFEIPPSAYVI